MGIFRCHHFNNWFHYVFFVSVYFYKFIYERKLCNMMYSSITKKFATGEFTNCSFFTIGIPRIYNWWNEWMLMLNWNKLCALVGLPAHLTQQLPLSTFSGIYFIYRRASFVTQNKCMIVRYFCSFSLVLVILR